MLGEAHSTPAPTNWKNEDTNYQNLKQIAITGLVQKILFLVIGSILDGNWYSRKMTALTNLASLNHKPEVNK
jgi:hypothetical protein